MKLTDKLKAKVQDKITKLLADQIMKENSFGDIKEDIIKSLSPIAEEFSTNKEDIEQINKDEEDSEFKRRNQFIAGILSKDEYYKNESQTKNSLIKHETDEVEVSQTKKVEDFFETELLQKLKNDREIQKAQPSSIVTKIKDNIATTTTITNNEPSIVTREVRESFDKIVEDKLRKF